MKVSRKVYFLILIIEECAEIIHRTCKAIRFGLDERWKPESKTNQELIEEEMTDLDVVRQLNIQEGNLNERTFPGLKQAVDRKRGRVTHYLNYSINQCQTVSSDDGPNPPGIYSNWKAANPVPEQ